MHSIPSITIILTAWCFSQIWGCQQLQAFMRKIGKYNKELQDEDNLDPRQFFQSLVPTGKEIKTDNTIRIHHTEQNLNSIRPQQTHHFTQEDILSPRSTAQFNPVLHLRKDDSVSAHLRQSQRKGNYRFQNSITQQKCQQMMKKRKKWEELKDVLTNQKINILKDIFIQKLKRNNPYSPPVQFDIGDDYKEQSFLDQEGIELSEALDHLFSIILIAQVMFSLFIYTLALVFREVSESTGLFAIQIISIAVALLQMSINFIHKKTVSGRKVLTLREIVKHYARNSLCIDAVNILALILSASTGIAFFRFCRLIVVSKFPQMLQRLQKLEIYIIDNYYNEQYWSLVKTFIFNFCFAHILAVLLVSMAGINDEHNWMVVKEIASAPWIQRYVWSYYWGTNIMLTVGFGDIVASTYQEAICLIFIETVSCLALAYNINCVGALISNIRAQDIQKSRNFKVFKKLIIKNNLPEQLSWRINNYIEQSINIKKKFSLQEEKQFIEKLPTGFKKEVLKESNKYIFDKLTFFHNLMDKTLYSLAEKIEMCIYHPEEIIQPLQDNYHLFILKAGQIGYVSKKNESRHFNRVIDVRRVAQEDNPFLINLHFITKRRANFQVKSLVYSMLYHLEHDKLIAILQESPMDYELYSYLRDKNKNVIDQFQVFPCEFCKTKHTKFNCPKLHFIPITQHVVNKHLRAYNIGKDSRNKNTVMRKKFENVLFTYQSLQNYHMIQTHKGLDTYDAKRKERTKRILQNLRRKRLKSNSNEEVVKREQALLQHTTEVIREQFVKLLGAELYLDEVWNVSLDRMRNYKSYFSLDNSSNLKEKFNCELRQSRLFQKFKTHEEFLQEKFIYGSYGSNEITTNKAPEEFHSGMEWLSEQASRL